MAEESGASGKGSQEQPTGVMKTSENDATNAKGDSLLDDPDVVAIRFTHKEEYLLKPVVRRFPGFADKFEDGVLDWPEASKRQAQIIVRYLHTENYWYASHNTLDHSKRMEREFTDALAMQVQAASFYLPGLVSLAKHHMEWFGNCMPFGKVVFHFMAQTEWCQRNAQYVGDPLLDGLIGAINHLRYAPRSSYWPPRPSHN
ncbi:hypothetical protein FBEOM_3421 [Fusarium beomiforme]|uniref:BTB domain-containing protein n=1 Tax=Fusarium beomiforme TaxID=44412 RepID=A0A9P5APP0_9HYPO|nr:hypothetical protein FBEOM_3421 [Fusarium beomiforme]